MAKIEKRTQTVFYAPTKGKRFMTLKGAAMAEAGAIIASKYPTESPEYEDYGRMTYAGFHWASDDRLVRVRKRLAKRIARAALSPVAGGGEK